MVTTLGIVELQGPALTTASGLELQSLADRKWGGQTLLEWLVRRVTESTLLDQVIVVSPREAHGQQVALRTPGNVPVFYSKHLDGLARVAAALKKYPAKAIVRVCVGNPFVDPALIDRLVSTAKAHPACEYISYVCADGRPAVQSQLGLFAEWCRADAVLRADRDATDLADRRDVTRYIFSHPELFQLRLLPIPSVLDRGDVRLAIHSEEDWDHAQTIFDALGPESLDWQRIAGLLDYQPEMRQRMALLNRAEAD